MELAFIVARDRVVVLLVPQVNHVLRLKLKVLKIVRKANIPLPDLRRALTAVLGITVQRKIAKRKRHALMGIIKRQLDKRHVMINAQLVMSAQEKVLLHSVLKVFIVVLVMPCVRHVPVDFMPPQRVTSYKLAYN